MGHAVGDLLLIVGAAVIVLDIVGATSTGDRSTLLRLRLQHTFPQLSLGLAVVLGCLAGAALITLGLDLLRAA